MLSQKKRERNLNNMSFLSFINSILMQCDKWTVVSHFCVFVCLFGEGIKPGQMLSSVADMPAHTQTHTQSRPCRPLKMEGSLRQSVAKAKIVGKVLSY